MSKPRKPSARADTSRKEVQLPIPKVRRLIWEEACEMYANGRAESVCVTLRKRFELSEAVVQAVLLVEGMKHERTAAALRTGIMNALEMGREAAEVVFLRRSA